MTTLAKTVSIADFAAELRKFPDAAFDQTEQIWKFLQDTPVASDSLAPYLTWDAQHYTRNLVDKTPLYELVAICWEVGQVSSVQDGPGSPGEDEDEELSAYNAYLARLNAEVKGHGRRHGLR